MLSVRIISILSVIGGYHTINFLSIAIILFKYKFKRLIISIEYTEIYSYNG
ncbi:hypothetical protein CLOSYM_03536 [[Clostridium] symbiosum ATCC 14940]|uniref:Uncharacterized protein n=1 Tax=[Clostridium] symbiosum ATCC 14940 TaxID=411472 RepID=A0ABC9TUF5_CLOSY|nr:hypothetical protein CLOSYM_03536 [[Clostridium] symbiosum ATCC 14940]